MFKVGDKVRCIEIDNYAGMNVPYLTLNNIYTVKAIAGLKYRQEIYVEELSEHAGSFYAARFELVEVKPSSRDFAQTMSPITATDLANQIQSSTDKTAILTTANNPIMTLSTDSKERKNYPLFDGLLKYFPAALAGVAKTSKLGNDKHNPGQEMHHARSKSSDHGDCIIRHLIDTADLLASMNRGEAVTKEEILAEASSLAWRALAFSQELHEKFGAPLAPGAKK